MEFVQYIIENRNNIVTLNSDFIRQKKSNVATYFEEEEELWEDIEKRWRGILQKEECKKNLNSLSENVNLS